MVKLALLWHMHQPFYEDLVTGEHILPWVRLHALKDYFGMVRLLQEFPDLRVTFNLVPSLLVQLRAFAAERASDRHLTTGLKPAEALDQEERDFLTAHGFHVSDRMLGPYARYAELRALRDGGAAFTTGDLRDLQVWHKLVWMDPDLLSTDARLKALLAKARDFSEADKQELREVELEILRSVIPEYAAAAARGQAELSTSPFYHPILPLLCDTDVHFYAHPRSSLARGLFRWPEDAREQLRRAIRLHRELFGEAPRGIWPAEGSVSDAAVRLIADAGCQWMATDEGILRRSLGGTVSADALYRPHEVGEPGTSVRCLFRDHGLSDLIGFSYQSWEAETAAEDFVRRVAEAGDRYRAAGGLGDPVVTIILDGENAWEHYADGGRPFLRALYRRLQRDARLETVTMAEAAAAGAQRLPSLFPGSWINNDFYIWAGHPDDHRAWAQLAAARRVFDAHAADVAPPDRERAFEELLIAEGSDWFWWYGDDHSSDHDREFDDLFRRHLRNVYRALGRPVPDALWVTNITTAAVQGSLRPQALIDPVIDGEVTGFAEWMGAVMLPRVAGGTMHRVAPTLVRSVFVGIGTEALFLRVDGPGLLAAIRARRQGLAVLVAANGAQRIELVPASPPARVAVGTILEAALPLSEVAAGSAGRLSVSLLLTDPTGHVIEQYPPGQPIEIEMPPKDVDAVNWAV